MTGCSRELSMPGSGIPVSISQVALEGAKLQRASVITDSPYAHLDYVIAVLNATSDHCGNSKLATMLPHGNLLDYDDADSLPPPGTTLWQDFHCASIEGPNLTKVSAGALDALQPSSVKGSRAVAWTSYDPAMPKGSQMTAHKLLGGMVRDAYVDGCNNAPLTIRRIATMEEAPGGIKDSNRGRVGVTLDYRCEPTSEAAAH